LYLKQQNENKIRSRNQQKLDCILKDLLDEHLFKDVHIPIWMTPTDVNKPNENIVLRTIFKQSSKERETKIKFKVRDRLKKRFKYTFGNKYDPY
jgi:hypothetical protein